MTMNLLFFALLLFILHVIFCVSADESYSSTSFYDDYWITCYPGFSGRTECVKDRLPQCHQEGVSCTEFYFRHGDYEGADKEIMELLLKHV